MLTDDSCLYHQNYNSNILTDNEYNLWFGLVSLFNGISTFVGYLMPMPFS